MDMPANAMDESSGQALSRQPTLPAHYGLQHLEGELLSFVGVAAGLRASITLCACCRSLQAAIASAVMDEQLFGRLYAALAGVNDPRDALLHPLPSATYSRATKPEPNIRNEAPHHRHRHDRSASSPEGAPQGPESSGSGKRGGERDACEHSSLGRRRVVDAPCPPSSTGNLPTPREASPKHNEEGASTQKWRALLRMDLAPGRRPSGSSRLYALDVGRHDVLMAVVASNPPVIALTATTNLFLFHPDGKRLPAVRRPMHPSPPAGRIPFVASVHRGPGGTADPGDEPEDEGIPPYLSHWRSRRVKPTVVVEAHERDIRSVAGSPEGDMVATGSLDCTIRVRSLPECDWVRRLRGHEAGVSQLAFHRSKLVSADGRGIICVWDVFPITRRLQKIQAHSDSVQALTTTGGGDRLASGALDGKVIVWSMSADGTLSRMATHGGLCHPYQVLPIGRFLAFASSGASSTGVQELSSEPRADVVGDDGNSGHDGVSIPSWRNFNVSIVGVCEGQRAQLWSRVCQLHRLAAGPCIGTLMLSPTDPIHIALNDNAYDGADDEAMVSMSRDDFAPRLYRVVSATKTTASDALPRQGPSNGEASGACRGGNGATQGVGFQLGERDEHRLRPRSFEWVPISRSRAPESLQIRTERDMGQNVSKDFECDDGGQDPEGDALDDAMFVCATFVGRTLFMGYDTGYIWAHRVSDGRRLYRLDAHGPVAHLVAAQGSLVALSGNGLVLTWTWRNN